MGQFVTPIEKGDSDSEAECNPESVYLIANEQVKARLLIERPNIPNVLNRSTVCGTITSLRAWRDGTPTVLEVGSKPFSCRWHDSVQSLGFIFWIDSS
jgi:hypothetical protein